MNKLTLYYRKFINREPKPDKWVFIVGCYNSGTTILHDVLAQHPMVGSMEFEGQYMTDQLMIKYNNLERLWAINADKFYMDDKTQGISDSKKIKIHWGIHINHPKRPVLIEKSPTNAARLLWLQREFPNAYFIGIIRNGYAVAEGIHRKVKHDISLCAKQWAISNEIMLRDFELMKNKMMIQYEEFTAQPFENTNKLTSFLNLPPLNENILNSEFQIRSDKSGIKNMNKRSFESLSEIEKISIEENAGEMLRKLGYFKNFN